MQLKKNILYFGIGTIVGIGALFFIIRKFLVKYRAVSIAKKEWEGWGKPLINEKGQVIKKGGFESDKGFSERVGKYWRLGTGQSFTGKDRDVAWSSAFISYIMKKAGAGDKFSYSPSHSKYIRDSIQNRKKGKLNAPFVGFKVNEVAPEVGDLVCYSRQGGVDYNTTDSYLSHCDLVVAKDKNKLEVIGGNVNQSVTKRLIETDNKGKIKDKNKNWFAVIKSNV